MYAIRSYYARLLFLVADDQLIRKLLQAMFPNFIRNFLVSQILDGAPAGGAQPPRHLGGVLRLMLGDVHDDDSYNFV